MIQNQYTNSINQAVQQAQEVRSAKEGWTLQIKGEHLSISSKPWKDSGAIIFKIEGTVGASLNSVQKLYFEDNEGLAKNRDTCEGVDVLEVVNQDTQVTVLKMKSVSNQKPKDNLNIKHRKTLSANEILIVHGHLDQHPNMINREGVDRFDIAINAQFLTETEVNKTHLEIYFLRDADIAVPVHFLQVASQLMLSYFEKDANTLLLSL